MILEEATKEAFGYYPSELTRGSGKPIVAACERCGGMRVLFKHGYSTFCRSCSQFLGESHKGKKHTEETKAKISAAEKGKILTKEHIAKISTAKKGEKNPNFGKRGKGAFGYRGGNKIVWARRNAKRKRELGYTLLLPLEDGEVGHHVTNEYVIGMPKEVHEKLSGLREMHRAKVLEWLKDNDKKKYEMALSALSVEGQTQFFGGGVK